MNYDAEQGEFPNSPSFQFGDNEDLCHRLLSLVRAGHKTATCGAWREFEPGTEKMPEVGSTSIALNWNGTPALAIRITSVSLTRFCDVGESFALAEGENETLEGWQADHQQFFERNGASRLKCCWCANASSLSLIWSAMTSWAVC